MVATLFLFELSFILLLIFVNNNSEHSLVAERKATEMIGHIARSHRFLDEAAASMALIEHSGPNPVGEKKIESALQSLLTEVALLKPAAESDAAERKIVDRFDDYANEVKRVSVSYLQHVHDGNKSAQSAELLTLLKMGQEIEPEHKALYRNFEIAQQKHYLEGKARRHNLITLMWCGVALNVLAAVVCLELFGSMIGRRLKIMTDNIVRLEKKQELNPIIGNGHDEIEIVDRRFHEMAHELAEAERRYREVERLKQEFVTMISHDLRAPLTSLQFTLGLLSDGTYGDINEQGQHHIHTAEGSCLRLVRMINELLDLEKMESGNMHLEVGEFFVDELFDQAVAGVAGMAHSKSVELEVRPLDTLLMGDRNRLVEVLVNLLSNAIKFSPSGSKVLLSAEEGRPGFLKFCVQDHGEGIPEEYQQMVFDRFKQVKSEKETSGGAGTGTGLGLAIAKSVVELHAGHIGLESQVGKGSTFWFELPKEVVSG